MQTFSGTDILDLLKQFMKNCPESPPLGGSLSALKQGMVEEEDPHYDYAWDPGAIGVAVNTVIHTHTNIMYVLFIIKFCVQNIIKLLDCCSEWSLGV